MFLFGQKEHGRFGEIIRDIICKHIECFHFISGIFNVFYLLKNLEGLFPRTIVTMVIRNAFP